MVSHGLDRYAPSSDMCFTVYALLFACFLTGIRHFTHDFAGNLQLYTCFVPLDAWF